MNSDPKRPEIPTDLLVDALEALSEGIAIYDADERLVLCNNRYKELLGPLNDMIVPGMHWRDLVHGCVEKGMVETRHESGNDWLSTSEEQRGRFEQETEIRQTDGRTFRISYNPTKTGGFVVTREDITDRRDAENMARDREALLETILRTNPTPVVMARLDDAQIIYHSPAANDLYGEITHASDYFIEPDGRANYIAKLKQHGQVTDDVHRVRAHDGSERVVSLSGGLTEYNGEPHVVSSVTDVTEKMEREALIRKIVESYPAPVLMNRPSTGDILFKSPGIDALLSNDNNARSYYVDIRDRDAFLSALYAKGELHGYRVKFWNAQKTETWFAVSARLIKWEGEDMIVSHILDLTQQLETEAKLDQQREQLFQNEKMSALGGLLAGVAHELNNPLSVVVGHAMMLQEETTDPEIQRQVGKISTAAERCAKIVKTFLTMARQDPVRMTETNVNEVVATAVEVARFGHGADDVRIEADLSTELDLVCIDADQITQVIINLILNAEQAIKGSAKTGRILIKTQRGASDKGVTVSVEDNGPGVPKDVRARVFDPFFTTKGVGEGTGIGLAVCHRIVTAHRGTIALEEVKPNGARFTVSLPCNGSGQQSDPGAPEDPHASRVASVLIIDDEVDVADLNAEVLERGGFKAQVAYRAADAINLLRETSFDAIISDLNMPDIDGRGLHDVIREEFPNLLNHTGFITGDTMGRSSQGFLKESERPYLEKPVSPKELRAFVLQLCRDEGVQ